jgi:hypothetical protein
VRIWAGTLLGFVTTWGFATKKDQRSVGILINY